MLCVLHWIPVVALVPRPVKHGNVKYGDGYPFSPEHDSPPRDTTDVGCSGGIGVA